MLSQSKLRLIKTSVLLAVLVGLSGCSTVGSMFNPFESKFRCNAGDGEGRCGSVQENYKAELGGGFTKKTLPDAAVEVKEETKKGKGDPALKTISVAETPDLSYRTASLNKMTKMLKDPVTPLVAPPVVLRILILPYQDDDNGLNLMRYSYLMIDKPKWIMGDYLDAPEQF